MKQRDDLPGRRDRKPEIARLLLILAAVVAVTMFLAPDTATQRGAIAGVLFLGACILYAGSNN